MDANINFVEAQAEVLPLQAPKPIISLSADTKTCSVELFHVSGSVLKIKALPAI